LLLQHGANPSLRIGVEVSVRDPQRWGHYHETRKYTPETGPSGELIYATTGNETPLHLASYRGHAEAVEALLKAGAEPNTAERWWGRKPLHLAAEAGHTEVIDALLDGGAEIEAGMPDGETPLHWAVLTGPLQAMRKLVEAGADPNAKDHSGKTPLHVAAIYRDTGIVRELLAHGAEPTATDAEGRTPLDMAREEGNEQIVQLLRRQQGGN
jgi:cytohesin